MSSKQQQEQDEKSSTMSCTLKIKSSLIQAEFTQNVRKQARDYAKVIIIVQLSVSLLTLIGSRLIEDDGEYSRDLKSELLHTSFIFGPSSLVIGTILLLSFHCRLAIIECISPVMFMSTALSLVVIISTEVTGHVTSLHRLQFNFLVVFINWTFALFLGVTWRWGFLARCLFFMPTISLLMINREREGDDQGGLTYVLSSVFVGALVELSVYSNMKAKAQLFYKLKSMEQ